MGLSWGKNLLLPMELSEKEMSDIPYPRAELHVHVMYKTCQVGSILGLFIAPAAAVFTRRANQMVPIMGKYVFRGAMIGIPAGPAMTELMLNKKEATPESIYDRCYRIRHNRNQVRVDRVASYGDVTGFTAGLLMKGSPILGACYGFALGTVATGLYNNVVLAKKKEE